MRTPTYNHLVQTCLGLYIHSPYYCQHSLPHLKLRRIITQLWLNLFGCIMEVIIFISVVHYMVTCIRKQLMRTSFPRFILHFGFPTIPHTCWAGQTTYKNKIKRIFPWTNIASHFLHASSMAMGLYSTESGDRTPKHQPTHKIAFPLCEQVASLPIKITSGQNQITKT